ERVAHLGTVDGDLRDAVVHFVNDIGVFPGLLPGYGHGRIRPSPYGARPGRAVSAPVRAAPGSSRRGCRTCQVLPDGRCVLPRARWPARPAAWPGPSVPPGARIFRPAVPQ